MASHKSFDLIVVGAGPAGSSAAYHAAKGGLNVLLLDKSRFPRDKICGGGLSPRSLQILKSMGLFDKIQELGQRGNRAIVYSNGGRLFEGHIPGDTKEPNHFLIVSRYHLDNLIVESAIKEGVDFKEETKVTGMILDGDRIAGVRAIQGGVEREYYSRLVVGANGAFSMLSGEFGNRPLKPRECFIAARAYFSGVSGVNDAIEGFFNPEILPGLAWLFPMKGGCVNVGFGMRYDVFRVKGIPPLSLFRKVIHEDRALSLRLSGATQEGKARGLVIPTFKPNFKYVCHGGLLAGDAACLVDPLSGEGIIYALISGRIAAGTAIYAFELGDFSKDVLSRYSLHLREHIYPWLKGAAFLLKLPKVTHGMEAAKRRAVKDADFAQVLSLMACGLIPKGRLMSWDFFLHAVIPFWRDEIKRVIKKSRIYRD